MTKRIISILVGISFVISFFVSGCSNNSDVKESKPAISTNEVDDNKTTKTEDTSKYNPEEVAKEKANSAVVPKEINTDVVVKFVKSLGYKVQTNSIGCYWTVLPKDFNEVRNDFEIGKFLNERNQKSIKYGFDFSQYMGKNVAYVTLALEKYDKDTGELIAFLSDDKIVGVWTFDYSDIKNSDHMLLTEHLEHN